MPIRKVMNTKVLSHRKSISTLSEDLASHDHCRKVHQFIFCAQLILTFLANLLLLPEQRLSFVNLIKSDLAVLSIVYLLVNMRPLIRQNLNIRNNFAILLGITIEYLLLLEIATRHLASENQFAGLNELFFPFVFLLLSIRMLYLRPLFILYAGVCAMLTAIAYVAISHSTATSYIALSKEIIPTILVISTLICAHTASITAIVSKFSKNHPSRLSNHRNLANGFERSNPNYNQTLCENYSTFELSTRKTAALFTIKIRDFTEIAHRFESRELSIILGSYHELIAKKVTFYGGIFETWGGDNVMAYFGATNSDPFYAAQAIRCIENIIDLKDEMNMLFKSKQLPQIELRAVCDVGEVITTNLHTPTGYEYRISGKITEAVCSIQKSQQYSTELIISKYAFDTAKRQGFQNKKNYNLLKTQGLTDNTNHIDLIALQPRAFNYT